MAAIVCPKCGVVDCDNSEGWRKVRLCGACLREEADQCATCEREQALRDKFDSESA